MLFDPVRFFFTQGVTQDPIINLTIFQIYVMALLLICLHIREIVARERALENGAIDWRTDRKPY